MSGPSDAQAKPGTRTRTIASPTNAVVRRLDRTSVFSTSTSRKTASPAPANPEPVGGGETGGIILHELGHSLVARHRGVGIASITLFVFGGVSQMKEEPREARHELEIAIVGPLISLVLAAVFRVLAALVRGDAEPGALAVVLTYLAVVNLIVAIFNMLPAFPLDGGRVLRATSGCGPGIRLARPGRPRASAAAWPSP